MAEVVAAIGLAASIVQLADYTKKAISRIKQLKQGSAFEDALSQLDLFLHDILKISSYISSKKNEDDEAIRTFSRVIGGCSRQMIILNDIIASVIPSKTSSSLRKTWAGLRSMGKDAKIRETIAILDSYRATMTLHMVTDLSYSHVTPSATDIHSKGEERTFEVPRRRVAYFVGRRDLLKKLSEFIMSERSPESGTTTTVRGFLSPSRIAVLVGLGGQGKTQIALELCRQCQNDYGTIIWINASSRDTALSDIKKTIRRLPPEFESSNDAPTILMFFHQWLRDLVKPWMLVFDNYDDPVKFPEIASFYPDYGSVIITSRHNSSRRLGKAFEVGAMTDEEGRDLLLRDRQRAAKDANDADLFPQATAVVAKLGNLALAIDQAASYISTRQMSLQMFAEVFESRKKAILDHTPAMWEYRDQTEHGQALSAFTTWEMSINQVGSDEKQRASITDFLTLLAFLDATSVKESLFSTYVEERPRAEQNPSLEIFLTGEKWDSAIFQDLVTELVELALVQHIEYDEGYLLITLHPIIKDWLQLRINPTTQQMMVQDSIDILAVFLTKNDAVDLPYRLRSALLRHIDHAEVNVGRFLKTDESKQTHGGFLQGQQAVFATFYGKHDRTAEAESLFAEVLSKQTQCFGPMNIASLATANNLAGLYLRSRRFEEAEVLLRRVLRGKEQLFPSDDLRITNTVNELGNVCSHLGRYEEARHLYSKNLEIFLEKVFLQNEATSLNKLKIVYSNLGEVAMREGNLVEAGKRFETALGQGRNAQPTCQVVRESDSEGPLDEIDCQILMNKGRLLNCAGLFDQAHKTYERGCQGLVLLLGPKHSKVVAAERELTLMNPSKISEIDSKQLEEFRHSQNCDRNPSIRGQCVNWGSGMQQSQLLHPASNVNQQAMQREAQSSSASQQAQIPLRNYIQDGQVASLFLSRDRTITRPKRMINNEVSPHISQLQQQHPFISEPKRIIIDANNEVSPHISQLQQQHPFISEPKRLYYFNEKRIPQYPQPPQGFSPSLWGNTFDSDYNVHTQAIGSSHGPQNINDDSNIEPMDGIQ